MPKAVPVVSVYEVFSLYTFVSQMLVAKISGYPRNVYRMTEREPL